MDRYYHLAEDRFFVLLSRQLANSISVLEKEELATLMNEYPDLRLKADLFDRMWTNDTKAVTDQDLNEAYMRHLLRYRADFLHSGEDQTVWPESVAHSLLHNKWFYSLAGLLVIVVAGLYFNFFRKEKAAAISSPAMNSVITRYGNKSRVGLPDGSMVWLNAGSRLDYIVSDFTRKKREVFLSGEAYFEIVHDAANPFFVRSGKMQIKVLGTSFNVKAYPEENNIETSLINGSVEITINDRPDDIYILKPNEKLVVSNENVVEKAKGSGLKPTVVNVARDIVTLRKVNYTEAEKLIPETAWVHNKLVFRSEKFSDLAVRMERWYGISIRFRDREKEGLLFTGIFTTETITQALNAMAVVHPFRFTIDNDTIYID